MSYTVKNFVNNDDISIISQKGPFSVLQYKRDLSVTAQTAQVEFFMQQMNVRRRQLLCDVSKSDIVISAGAMQWMVGNVKADTDVKGVGDLVGKAMKGKVTGESAIKPRYSGTGKLVLEPTYKHLLLWDLAGWPGGVVLDDGLFLACEARIKQTIKTRSNLSSAVLGKEGFFNLCLQGEGTFCVESHCPEEELVTIELNNDVLKIDGNYAIAWSTGLKFTVQKVTKTLLGSAASGEGFVNVYSGTGRVVMQPVR